MGLKEDQNIMQDEGLTTIAAPWVDEMRAHFEQTGEYRADDLRRLLGDPAKGVEVGSPDSLSAYLLQA